MYNPFLPSDIAWMLIAAALLFNVALTALFYMVAQLLTVPSMVAQAKEQITQLIMTVFLIAIFVGSQGILTSLFGGIICFNAPSGVDCSNLSSTPIAVGTYALDLLINSLLILYTKMYMFEASVAILSSISFTFGVFRVFLFVFSIHLSPFIALTLIANAQVIIVEGFGYLVGVTFAKKQILQMVEIYIPIFLVPLGLFFRSIPFLRSTGSTIMALCFTMYFIFPIAVIFTNYVIYDAYQSSPMFINFENPSPISHICSQSESINITTAMDDITEDLITDEKAIDAAHEQTQGWGTKIWDFLKGIGTTAWDFLKFVGHLLSLIFNGNDFFSALLPVGFLRSFYFYMILELMAASQFLVLVTITTLLEFIIIVTAHRSISAAIGGETEIFGLSKIV